MAFETATPTYTSAVFVGDYLGKTFDGTTTPTDTQINEWIIETDKIIDEETGTSWKNNNVVEYYDFNQYTAYASPSSLATVGNTGRRDNGFGLQHDQFTLSHRPIISIVSLSINEASETETDSFTILTEQTGSSGDFIVNKNTGVVTFLNKFPRFGKRSIKVDYNWGRTLVPLHVRRLATLLVAKQILSSVASSGQTESVDNISIGEISISKGITQSVSFRDAMDREIQELWDIIGRFEVDAI